MKQWNKNGVTVLEFMVASVLTLILLGGLMTIYVTGKNSWERNKSTVLTQREVRKALSWMTRELRGAENLVVNQSPNDINPNDIDINFVLADTGNVLYSWKTTGGSPNLIVRTVGAQTRTIAQNISALNVTQTLTDVIINITASAQTLQGETTTFQLEKKVVMR